MQKLTQVAKEAKVVAHLMTSDTFLEIACIEMLKRQTADERNTKSTNHNNGRGFKPCDAPKMTGLCKWVTNGKAPLGKRMNPTMREKARAILPTYRRQLVEIVEEIKAAKGQ